jgi:protein phosphatase
VGDSRIYHMTASGIRQISTDHSLVAELVRRGELSPLDAAHHPRRNYITRALGVDRVAEADYAEITPVGGEYLLLCSDGLYTEVSEPELYYEVFHSGHPELACGNLVQLANSRGGRDNISIILISF